MAYCRAAKEYLFHTFVFIWAQTVVSFEMTYVSDAIANI